MDDGSRIVPETAPAADYAQSIFEKKPTDLRFKVIFLQFGATLKRKLN